MENKDITERALLPEKFDVETFKSVYYWLNAKPDTHIKIFRESKLITLNDIISLNTKVQKKLENHNIVTNMTTIVISLDKGEIKSFNSWEVFKNYSWEIPEETESISINWDISVQLPNFRLPQKHTLKVRIGTSLRPNEIFQLITNSDSELELQENLAFLICKVDFINVILSNELTYIVEEWYSCLAKLDAKSKLQTLFEKHKSTLARIGNYLMSVISILLYYIIFKFQLKNIEYTSIKELYADATFWFVLFFIILLIGNFFGHSFNQLVLSKINSYEESHYFLLTKGDQLQRDKLLKANKKITYNLVWQFIIRLFVSLTSVIFAKFLGK